MKTASEFWMHLVNLTTYDKRAKAIATRDREVFEKVREACRVVVVHTWAKGDTGPGGPDAAEAIRALTFEEAMKD